MNTHFRVASHHRAIFYQWQRDNGSWMSSVAAFVGDLSDGWKVCWPLRNAEVLDAFLEWIVEEDVPGKDGLLAVLL